MDHGELLQKVLRCAAAGNYQKALDLLRVQGSADDQLRNACGVCLLRLGRTDQAIQLFRQLVLQPGCTWLRPGTPVHWRTNYATALLLGGRPAGCLEVLAEANDETNPHTQKLRAAVRQWESELSLWQRINWKLGSIAPSSRPVRIDFEPGEFGVPLQQAAPVTHAKL